MTQLVETLPAPSPEVVRVIEEGRALPVLDLGAFIAGEPGAELQLAADIRLIQETLGFYSIVNFGFDPALIEQAYDQNRKLFALPEEARRPYEFQGHMQGYWPMQSIVAVRPGYEGESEQGSQLGGWTFLREREADDPKVVSGMRHRAMNKWPNPELLPDYRPIVSKYHSEMVNLGLKLIEVYALSLDLPRDYFAKDFDKLEWYSRNNFMKKTAANAVTPHSDHSFLTLLPISPVPGLQVRTPDGNWINAAYTPEALIVNTGEWLNQLTNGRYLATPHRVEAPTEDRISMPVFINPNDEAVNDPVPGAVPPGEARKYPPRGWHEFFLSYIDGYTQAVMKR
ncbi:isopenicillin N synthase family dioxygenase [Novosphingobium sp. BL-52-GroH]|uniref:isopenicillin N synthase family dioxygenase n=1 Tax=Novosphingobium sp. BL-52-GroH TaxID=3349877 RepID=UPI00384B88E7